MYNIVLKDYLTAEKTALRVIIALTQQPPTNAVWKLKKKRLHKILSLWSLFSTFFLICECPSSSTEDYKILKTNSNSLSQPKQKNI